MHELGKETAVSFAPIFANLVSYRSQTRLHILRACGVDSTDIVEHHNILLLGATGSGKTYLACALGMAVVRNFLTVKYIRLPELLAELAIAMMIYMSRNQFTPATGTEISGKTVGIQAFGNVGRLVGQKAAALGMKVKAVDPFIPAEKIAEAGAEPVADVAALYSSSDFVSVHIPALPSTIGSIGYDLITSMPKGAVLVNTARKEVIDEAGLERALEDRPDLKYVADVMPDNYEALREKFGVRIFATPKKMGAQTSEANVNAGLAAARQIVAYFTEGCTRFQVNK